MNKTKRKNKKKDSSEIIKVVAKEAAESIVEQVNTIEPPKISSLRKRSPHHIFDVIECLRQRVGLLEQKVQELEKKN